MAPGDHASSEVDSDRSEVSVVMATYNGARFVEAQLESILRQSLPPDEVVVSDDGSTDDTLPIVRRIAARHPEATVRIIDGARRGVAGNFERGLLACRGSVIALADQDDVWHPDRLALALQQLAGQDDVLFQHADAEVVGSDGQSTGLRLLAALGVDQRVRDAVRSGAAFEEYLRRNLATGATVVIRRRLLDQAVPFPIEWVHDEWLAIIASALGPVQLLDDAVIDYRQHGANQIGVVRPSLGHRLGRVLERRGDRTVRLARRAAILVERLDVLGVDSRLCELARGKARFEAARAGYADNRLRRIPDVFREALHGSYRAYASQGRLDIMRDLLQPA